MDKSISVIVPIYNMEKYLEKCIQSIVKQTYKNLQIILVDDGSTDDSTKICDLYHRLDERIAVIHKTNGGLVSARKKGVQAATGDFIAWVDADDWIESNYLEKLIMAQQKTGADIVTADLSLDIGSDSNVVKNHFDRGIYNPSQLIPKLLYAGDFFTYGIQPHIYTKLIKRELITPIQLKVNDRIVSGEDAAVIYPCILSAEKIYISDICGYHYVQRQGTMTKTSCGDELNRVLILLEYLTKVFMGLGSEAMFQKQLAQYKKYLLILRQMSVFDRESGDVVLAPYGGIKRNSKIVIYGAGGVGQKLYRYLQDIQGPEIIDWLDQNYEVYRDCGYEVNSPDSIKKKAGQYDFVIIANISQDASKIIRKYLCDLGVVDEKILWFAASFLEDGYEVLTQKVQSLCKSFKT